MRVALVPDVAAGAVLELEKRPGAPLAVFEYRVFADPANPAHEDRDVDDRAFAVRRSDQHPELVPALLGAVPPLPDHEHLQ